MNTDDLRAHWARPENAEWVKRKVDEAPPLTTEQRVALYELLRPVRQRRAAQQRRALRQGGA
ncbi:Uncharacterised protein [Mycolicibacterium fortuitum]|uniref:Uncharacterized protein n=1 Tax=Mycolicibacterium fortuitum TaxID=1766 RepID=A0A378UXY7_MYCFO|nr:Uncharacterised protein [Mycolicibacterium fortuitum]